MGLLGGDARKFVRKMFQLFEERKYLVGHMFYTPDLNEWHFFCFDQRDIEGEKENHWEQGPHVHFLNWVWPRLDAQAVSSKFVKGKYKPGKSMHIQFVGLV